MLDSGTCGFNRNAEILTVVGRLAICILDLLPENSNRSKTEGFICKEEVNVAQFEMEKCLMC